MGAVDIDTITIAHVGTAWRNVKLISDNVVSYYIQEFTREEIFAIAGPKFVKFAGMKIIIVEAFYVLKSSGEMWDLKLSENLTNMVLPPYEDIHNIWMRDRGDHLEYEVVMVEDILVFGRDPYMIIEPLK